jgi:uncharacterized protein YndB with AHSA1/START domain
MVDLRHSVPINAPAAKVFAAIATSEGNKGWWTTDSVVSETIGGKADFGFSKRATVFHMTIDRRTPNRELIMSCSGDPDEWAGTTLNWRIEERDGETILHFTHAGWRQATDFCASCNSMWGNLIFRLKSYAETGKAAPQWTE